MTPIQHINYKGFDIWIKRDDLIHPYISGNKWRKLKYILRDVKKQGKQHLITFGGAFSNHIIATAAAAEENGLTATAFIRGEEVENDILKICREKGMSLRFVSREAYKNKRSLFDAHFGDDTSAYFIDEGGAGRLAMKGCAELISELPDGFDHIFCAAGTGTTAAGLVAGTGTLKYNASIEIIPVLKGGGFIRQEIINLAGHANGVTLHTDFHFGGYARTTPGLVTFIKDFTAVTGVPTDPVYTGKMFFAIHQLQMQNHFRKDAKILAIHTGGLLGILGMKDKFVAPES